MGDTDEINQIFRIVDSDGSGYLDRNKLQLVCPHLSSTEIDLIFNDLDADHDNRISLKEFTVGFKYLCSTKTNNDSSSDENLTKNLTQTQISEVFNNLSCQEQIYEFYEKLRTTSSESIEDFQSILEVFISDIMKYRKDIQRLEESFRREKEMNEKYLRRIEEDQEREMRQLEEKIRQEEKQKFESEREFIQQRSSKNISDLQAQIQRLQTIEQFYRERQITEDSSIVSLREEISKLTQENQMLNSSLNDSLTTVAILKSDMQSLKTQLNERQTMLLQEKQVSSSNYHEREAMQSNIRQLVEVNKTLRDENDTLRATIESNKSVASPADASLVPLRSMSRAGSILETYWKNPKLDHVPMAQLGPMYSIDYESTDELGKNSLLSSSTSMCKSRSRQNTFNDSGLSLTTIRDINEVDSDPENKQIANRTSKLNRSLSIKRTNQDTDSDEIFDGNSTKRWSSLHRSSKRMSTKQSNRKSSQSSKNDVQHDPIVSNLPFDRMYKVVFCGDAAVGKSTLIMRLCKGKFITNLNSTLGVDFQNKQLELDEKRIAIQLWDTAGQERFRSMATSYFRRCDGVILVYDSTYERSFLNVREWIDTINDSTSKKVSVMIVANKIDLRDQLRVEGRKVIEHDDGAKLAKEYKALFIETSAKEGINSDEILIELTRDMQCNEDLERSRVTGIDLDKTTKKSACCGSRS